MTPDMAQPDGIRTCPSRRINPSKKGVHQTTGIRPRRLMNAFVHYAQYAKKRILCQ
jgi:hypothetical protein